MPRCRFETCPWPSWAEVICCIQVQYSTGMLASLLPAISILALVYVHMDHPDCSGCRRSADCQTPSQASLTLTCQPGGQPTRYCPSPCEPAYDSWCDRAPPLPAAQGHACSSAGKTPHVERSRCSVHCRSVRPLMVEEIHIDWGKAFPSSSQMEMSCTPPG